jgi:flagellar basal-body rod modification protein FlgD
MDVTQSTPNVTPGPAIPRETPSAQPSPKNALSSDFETFLRMLTTQMENQDPLNPMASTEFATQLATFSSVEQQTKSNELLSKMATQLNILGMGQLTGWVGMEARTSDAIWADGRAISFTPGPASAADRMAIVARDADGAVAGRIEMAASDAPLSWTPAGSNGAPLPAGAYSFELESLNGGEVVRTDPLEVYAPIVEVRNEGGTTSLILQGGVKVAPETVSALRQPGA